MSGGDRLVEVTVPGVTDRGVTGLDLYLCRVWDAATTERLRDREKRERDTHTYTHTQRQTDRQTDRKKQRDTRIGRHLREPCVYLSPWCVTSDASTRFQCWSLWLVGLFGRLVSLVVWCLWLIGLFGRLISLVDWCLWLVYLFG